MSKDKIIEFPNFKIALCESNTPQKHERKLKEAIAAIAPEWCEGETRITLNRNVQCKTHRWKQWHVLDHLAWRFHGRGSGL